MKETKHALAPEGDPKADARAVMAVFEAYKTANDQRLAEIEAGRPDPLLEEKVARLDAAVAAANARMDRGQAEARRPSLAPVTPSTDDSAHTAAERKAAWAGYIRAGTSAGLDAARTERKGQETKGLAETLPSTGGYIAPPETEAAIERRLMTASPMREIAMIQTIGAGVYRKPVSIAGVTAGWAAEITARTETAPPTLDLLSFPAADLYACPAATQALLDDALVNLDDWLAAECEDAFAAQETDAFINGDGNAKPRGLLNYPQVADAGQGWGQIGYLATGVAGAFPAESPADRLLDLIYAPRAQFRPGARFVMNRRTVSAIRKFRDAEGDYIWQPSTQPGQTPTLFGYPVTEVETMPDIASGGAAVAFGDFNKGYLIVDRAGLQVLRDRYTAKPYVLFYTTKRVGGGVHNFDAVKLLKFSVS